MAEALVAQAMHLGARAGRNAASIHQLGQLTRRACDAAAQAVVALSHTPARYEVVWTATAAEADALMGWQYAANEGPEPQARCVWVGPPPSTLGASRVVPDAAALLDSPRTGAALITLTAAEAQSCWEALCEHVIAHNAWLHLRNAEAWCSRPLPAWPDALRWSASVASAALGGPTGLAALLVPRGHALRPLWPGGGQQEGRRAGTLPRDLVLGMGVAAATHLARHRKA